MSASKPLFPRHHTWSVSMAVKPSRIEGKGLFAVKAIKARQKIGEFEGEMISQREARRRAKSQRHIAIVEVNNGKAIDAAKLTYGFRFINHSCTPNTFMRIFRERAEFYTLRRIKAGEELTCNYGASHHEGLRQCTCGSSTCRKFL